MEAHEDVPDTDEEVLHNVIVSSGNSNEETSSDDEEPVSVSSKPTYRQAQRIRTLLCICTRWEISNWNRFGVEHYIDKTLEITENKTN